MTVHSMSLSEESTHGYFSPDLSPVLTVESGDTVTGRALNQDWLYDEPSKLVADWEAYRAIEKTFRRSPEDTGHALSGPIAIRGAMPGSVLEVEIVEVRPMSWGAFVAGGWPSEENTRLGLADAPVHFERWKIDTINSVATSRTGRRLPIRPFLGVLGLPDAVEAAPTSPFRPSGGNIDCRELIAGSKLYLPVQTEGALFSFGDGHALQGDGEVCGMGLECPMENVELKFQVRNDLELDMAFAETPVGFLTFGVSQDLKEASYMAVDRMLTLMGSKMGLPRNEALALASLVVNLRVGMINDIVYAVLPHDVLA